MTYAVLSFLDRSNETSHLTLHLQDLTSDGLSWPAILTDRAALKAALDAITKGVIKNERTVGDNTRLTNVIPLNGERERKWLIRYQDDVTMKLHWFEVPCADFDTLPLMPGSDFVDINDSSNAELVALIAAVNSNMRSEAGNVCTLVSIEGVGRNL